MLIEIKQGMDVPIAGAPEQSIVTGKDPERVALMGLDHIDLRPSVQIEAGEQVLAGQPLFVDRADPGVRYVAPASGRVVEINRGPRRSLLSVVIQTEGDAAIASSFVPDGTPAQLSRDAICQVLLAAGLWPSLRARPYGRVAVSTGLPTALFITAMDTNPLAADPRIVIRERRDDFVEGLAVVTRLAPATWLCTAPDADLPCPDLAGLTAVAFAGVHPAGLVGTHVRHLHPEATEVWHIGYQDVLAIGHLFRTGTISWERVISVAGPGVHEPRLVRTRAGADLQVLLDGGIAAGCRIISGSALAGRAVTPASGYLGRYHNQVSVLPEPTPEVMGFSIGRVLRGLLRPMFGARGGANQTTATHGLPGGMLPFEDFDRVWPFAVPPGPLLRALLIQDTETASELGCLALTEEDMALCSYVCPAKLDYAGALRDTLREIERGR